MSTKILTWNNQHRDIEIEVTFRTWNPITNLMFLFNLRTREDMCSRTVYVGSCTVWHRKDTGQRCSTSIESYLSDVAQYHKYNDRDGDV